MGGGMDMGADMGGGNMGADMGGADMGADTGGDMGGELPQATPPDLEGI